MAGGGINRAATLVLGACVLVGAVALAVWFLLLDPSRSHPETAVDHPLTDEAAMAQVVEPARQIGAIGHLRGTSGGYTLMSCTNEMDPPYQGTVYMNFELPQDALGYFQRLAAALVAHGWSEGPSPNHNMPAKMLTKDGITAIFNRNSDVLQMGTARVYGQCRNVSDHRRDATAWVDITNQLR
jgi:hypothetical protein